LSRMTRLFYEKYVPEGSLLAPLFANISHDHPERVGSSLGGVIRFLGLPAAGSCRVTSRYGCGRPGLDSGRVGSILVLTP
jgi:hypothetical protein